MWLTDMADALRSAGLDVVEHPGWKTRGRSEMRAVRGIMLHHTAGPAAGDLPSLNTVINGRPDVPGPLAQLMLARSGAWHVIAAGRCNHAGQGDWPGLTGGYDIVGIEGESTGTGDWTSAQHAAWLVGVRALARHYQVPSTRVIGHREWAPRRKIDPVGINMAEIRNYVAAEEDDLTPDENIMLRQIKDAVCRWADDEPVRVQDRTIFGVWEHRLPVGNTSEALVDAASGGTLDAVALAERITARVVEQLLAGDLVEQLTSARTAAEVEGLLNALAARLAPAEVAE